MTQGLQAITYPVKDLAKAKALYSSVLGVERVKDADGNAIGLTQPA